MKKPKFTSRDISWLSFNARVLQEAVDPTVTLKNRIHFLAIHSNNLDEFFSVRVPALKRQIKLELNNKNHKAVEKTQAILNEIHSSVIQQQHEFSNIWDNILIELNKSNIFLLNEKNLTKKQTDFIGNFYNQEVSPNINPLFIESIPPLMSLWAKSIFMAVVMRHKDSSHEERYAIIEIPTKTISRFLVLPSHNGMQDIILLEDIIRFHLPYIFSSFGYQRYEAHLFKVTQDSEIGMDTDISEGYIESIESGLKKRRKSKPICLLYDKEMDENLLEYIIGWLNLSKKDSIIPRGRIRNFHDFLNFPAELPKSSMHHQSFIHPELAQAVRVSDVIFKKDILICTPYHSFNSIIDLLREAAMDEHVISIKITAYRLARNSMICNALINAARNGKKVHVIMEIKATYDEESNIHWKEKLEDAGIKVSIGVANLKVHAKICSIKKIINNKTIHYGFVGTGNLNEVSAAVYADYFLLTCDQKIMKDINRIFKAFKEPSINWKRLKSCKTLLVSPVSLRDSLMAMIDREIKHKLNGKSAGIKLQLNSLSDARLIEKLYEAARVGVEIRLVVRSIMCAVPTQKSFVKPISAISIVDEYLEHGRIYVFDNDGAQEIYITSADWMVRNLDYRVEVAVRVLDPVIKKQLVTMLDFKFNDNVKARMLDNELSNEYVKTGKKKMRSQHEIYRYLHHLAAVKSTSKKGS
jgi:polyphosphate kinase